MPLTRSRRGPSWTPPGAVTLSFDYGYDSAGNRTSLAELDGSRITWSYDDTNQLTQQNRTGTGPYLHSGP